MNPLFFRIKAFWLLIVGKIKLHQTLLRQLSFGFGIVLILLIIGGFLYYNFYFKKDSLIKYVPKEAMLYSTLRINGEIKENLLVQRLGGAISKEYNLPQIDSAILNPYIGYNVALALIPKENNFYEYDYLVLLDLRARPDENNIKDKGFYWHYLKNDYFNTDIMAISNSQNIIEKVVAVRNQEWPSLASRIGVTINLNQLKISKPGKIFIDIEALGEHFADLDDLKLKTLFFSLSNANIDELYLSAEFKDNKIIFGNNELLDLSDLLLSQVPAGFIVSLSANNISDQLIQIINILSQLDPAYYQQVLKNREYSQGLLNLDWQNDVLTLFTGKSQLIVYPDGKYIIAIEFDNSIENAQKLAKLEDVIGSYYLINEPKQKEKQLPDGTYITQIVRDKSLVFKEITINDKNLKIFNKNGREFGYYYSNNVLILANSLILLNNLANNDNLFSLKNENFASCSTNLIFNPSSYSNILPILDNINLINYNEESGEIWLKLE
ncbi:DUF3352 domain-containing protein [Candidatus Falkowbacteria bacterium]|nr:DUF3352 domain-containing protein [Candidatus Falkowbacteria bacterium]